MRLHLACFLLFITLISPLVLSVGQKPWYRSKKWQERKAEKAEKEVRRQRDIKFHQEVLVAQKKDLKLMNGLHQGLMEEMREIPSGSSKQVELKNKIHQRREAEANAKRQKLVSYMLQKEKHEVSQALWQNMPNASSKQEKIKDEIIKLKSENTFIPALEPVHERYYQNNDRQLRSEIDHHERGVLYQEEALKALQKPEKKGLWRWRSFPGMSKKA
ncbi:uncharacterized protein FA14DRAFT_154756 [Meira miltonrushii]|uniref:Uncharacterized protein n=1 Tax=Meira miltonrushii TaxID=1280837 RepID=A0A316VH69_9BASI|nr:uncharacterized protein FA14DRAFT_154756 [Meira miltonrushii]PWN35341.1 hypothetical protein FA14DRAFT_154756 [Meira miltonrushii]